MGADGETSHEVAGRRAWRIDYFANVRSCFESAQDAAMMM